MVDEGGWQHCAVGGHRDLPKNHEIRRLPLAGRCSGRRRWMAALCCGRPSRYSHLPILTVSLALAFLSTLYSACSG